MSSTLTPDAAKANARSLQERLKRSGHEVKLSLCYELMAMSHGSPTWNALSGKIAPSLASIPADTRLVGLLDAARLERVDPGPLVRAYDALVPLKLDAVGARKTLGTQDDESALYVPLGGSDGCDEPFIALLTGRREGSETTETWTCRRWEMFCSDIQARHVGTHIHPRSRYIESRLEAYAVKTMARCVGGKAPRTEAALRDSLISRVEREWISHLAAHVPETLALAQATGIWDGEILPYLPGEDPIRAAREAGRYAWIHSGWYWPDDWGSSPQPWDGMSLATKWYANAASSRHGDGPGLLDDSLGYPISPVAQPAIDAAARARTETCNLFSETISLDIVVQSAPGLITSEVGYFGWLVHLAPFTLMSRRLEESDLVGFTEAAARFEGAMVNDWLVHASHPFLHALGNDGRLHLFEAIPNLYRARVFCLKAVYRMAADIGVSATLNHLASACPVSFKDQDNGLDALPLAPIARRYMDAIMAEAGIRTR